MSAATLLNSLRSAARDEVQLSLVFVGVGRGGPAGQAFPDHGAQASDVLLPRVPTDQLADVLGCVTELPRLDAPGHVGAHRLRQRDVHGAGRDHGRDVGVAGNGCQMLKSGHLVAQ